MTHVSQRESTFGNISSRAGQLVDQIDLEEVPRILRRRMPLLLSIIALAMLLAGAFLYLMPPRYTSELAIMVEGESGTVLNLQAALANQPPDEARILSQLTVIKSRKLAERVIEALGLEQDPEFNPALRPQTVIETSFGKVVDALQLSRYFPHDNQEVFVKQRVVDDFLEQLDAYHVPRSRTIVVKFTSKRPEMAATVLNTLADQYVLAGLEDKFDNARKSTTWLASRVQKLREQVEQAEAAVESYRKQHRLFETDQQLLISRQISDLNGRATDASIERGAAEAHLGQARRALASPDELSAMAQVLRSDLIMKLREEEALLERKEAEMREQLGPRHPGMIQLRAEQARLEDRIKVEIGRIVQGLESEVRVTRNREAALKKDQQNLERQLASINESSIGLRALERDAEAKRLLLEKLLASLNETSTEESVESQIPYARIISVAPVPERPSFPKILPTLLIAFLGSATLGILLAFVAEYFDVGFRSSEQLEVETGIPVLALVPKVKSRNPSEEVIRRPQSAFAEAVRSIYTRLLLTRESSQPKVVQLISAEANEGKSVLAMSLVRQWATLGHRALLLDADFRRSRVAQLTRLGTSPGLSDLLVNKAELDEAIQDDPLSSAHVIVAGEQPIEAIDLLGTRKLKALLEKLRDRYDFIVIDSPPCLAPADAEVIAGVVDATVMVVRWGHTRRRVVRYSLDKIGKFGGAVTACILSMVDLKKHAYYGYGDSSAYYRLSTDSKH